MNTAPNVKFRNVKWYKRIMYWCPATDTQVFGSNPEEAVTILTSWEEKHRCEGIPTFWCKHYKDSKGHEYIPELNTVGWDAIPLSGHFRSGDLINAKEVKRLIKTTAKEQKWKKEKLEEIEQEIRELGDEMNDMENLIGIFTFQDSQKVRNNEE